MALIQCPECGKDVSTYATACPHCGFPMDKANVPLTKKDFPHRKVLTDLFDAFQKGTLTTDHPLFTKMTKVSGDFSRNEEAYRVICEELEKRRFLGLPNNILDSLGGKYHDCNYGLNLVNILRDEVKRREFHVEFGNFTWKILEDGSAGKVLMCQKHFPLEYEMWPSYEKSYLQSPLHQYLNDDFLEEHFLWIEIEKMKERYINEGNDSSNDKVFILSKEEMEHYFPNQVSRGADSNIITRSIVKKTRHEIYQVFYSYGKEQDAGMFFSTSLSGGDYRPCIHVGNDCKLDFTASDLCKEVSIYKSKLQSFLSQLQGHSAPMGMAGRKAQLEKSLKESIGLLDRLLSFVGQMSFTSEKVQKSCWSYKSQYLIFKKEFNALRIGY